MWCSITSARTPRRRSTRPSILAEARRILRKIQFHYTPKHASWLNMVEIEIGVMKEQCVGRRIPDKDRLAEEIAVWETCRNEQGGTINWMFTVEKAREKMAQCYPSQSA